MFITSVGSRPLSGRKENLKRYQFIMRAFVAYFLQKPALVKDTKIAKFQTVAVNHLFVVLIFNCL